MREAENVTTVLANVRSIVGFLSFIFVIIMIYFRWLIQRFLQQAPVTPMTSSKVIQVKTAIQRVQCFMPISTSFIEDTILPFLQ